MTSVPEQQLAQYLKRNAAKLAGVLIHGNDTPAVSDISRDVLAKWSQNPTIMRLETSSLKSDPSRLVDEYNAMSLLGDRYAIVVSGCDETVLKALGPVLQSPPSGNFIVLESEALSKSSKLRLACEAAANFAATALYEEDIGSLKSRIRSKLAESSMAWSGDAEESFYALVGEDRTAVAREIEKLSLYCLGRELIGEDDVRASCGDLASFAPDELIDAALDGNFASVDRMLGALDRESSQVSAILMQLLFHIQKLQAMRFDMSGGATTESAMMRSRPQVFFKRKPAVTSQLKRFDLKALEEVVLVVSNAIAETRSRAALAEATTGRTLFWIANFSRSRLRSAS